MNRFSTTFIEKAKDYSFYHGNGLINGQKTIFGRRIGNQYISFIRVVLPLASVKIAQLIGLLHQRLGHVSNNVKRTIARNNLVDGLEIILNEKGRL